ncbi:MAG TPA: T9SS type A sorting domain-containing protein, partial [Saprospiraceae bacterium]|nr:T9SS type A sorting domain-containing protein [Saprospiraceae bacterium]
YGRLNAWRALRNLYAGNWQTSNVQNTENKTITINLPANARRLKVTLTWSDAPALANAARALVNDLDLELYHRASGKSWRPWVLNSFPHPDSLMQLPMRARDSLNNVEQITLEDPASGNYDIRVHGYDVSTPEQPFSLSWQWDTLGHVQWLFPAAGDYVLPNTRFAVRWEAIEAGTTARLEYSINGGASWLPAVEQVTLEAGYAHWVAPPVQSKALLRLVGGEHIWQSDTFFIAPPMELKVGFNCSDSILLYWKTEFYENKYLLYKLGERYLQPIATLSDTFVVLPKAQYPGLHYAIAPVLPDASIGQKSYTINYTTQGVDCYWRTFFANVRAGQAVLQLSLGTLYQVVSIAWERQEGADFVTLHTMQPDGRLELEWIDPAPRTGRNVYRVRLIFQNGTVSYSDSATLFFAQPQAHLVFPNPVRAGELLTILYGTPQEGLFFVLYDALGREYQRQPLSDIRSDMLLSGLPAGTFFYQIRQDSAVHGSGKIVVLP